MANFFTPAKHFQFRVTSALTTVFQATLKQSNISKYDRQADEQTHKREVIPMYRPAADTKIKKEKNKCNYF